MTLPWTVAAICGVLTAMVPLIIAWRQASGRIATSDASVLWQEAARIREDYRSRISELNEVVDRCEKRIEILEKQNDDLAKENNNLLNVVAKLEKELRSRVKNA